RDGDWWNRRSVGRQALEHLFARGELAAWRNEGFERVYDLPERVIPSEVLARPEPSEADAHRELVAAAANALGVATVGDLADYYRIAKGPVAARVAELVEAGRLERVAVEGWREPAFRAPGLRVARPRRAHATLLSPFDSLIWERERTSRLFDFDYRIEVYVPAPKRRYGYYVLPLLLGDALVARFDLKADRKAGELRVEGAYLEPGGEAGPVAEAAAVELHALGAWLGLGGLRVGRRGNLATALRAAAKRG
ncbi:MAG: crosslink repair DNA glycosylase YcaQ family protein, partial [Myxococcota bacterium]